MRDDLALTATGLPAICWGDQRYPVLFTIAGIKEWAEHKGQTFEQVLGEGWKVADLTEADIRTLLEIALKGGERRRVLFEGGGERVINKDLLDKIFELTHPTELVLMLVAIWNEPSPREPDPRIPESSPPGA